MCADCQVLHASTMYEYFIQLHALRLLAQVAKNVTSSSTLSESRLESNQKNDVCMLAVVFARQDLNLKGFTHTQQGFSLTLSITILY